MTSNKDLNKQLSYEKKSAWLQNANAIMRFGENYKQYLKSAKTEREFVLASVALAKKMAFQTLRNVLKTTNRFSRRKILLCAPA